MTTQTISMRALPYVPIDPCWLMESGAFLSDNPILVRASWKMLFYAWSAQPAGSLPPDFSSLGNISGLTPMAVGESYDELTRGWELRDGRLFHKGMAPLCERISSRFGDALQVISDQAAAVIQGPEEFELAAAEVHHRSKGRRLLPKDFMLTLEHRNFMVTDMVPDQADQDFIFEKFKNWARSSAVKMNDWDAAFKNFILKENKLNLPSRRNSVVPLVGDGGGMSRSKRFGSRGQIARDHNAAAMDRARGGGRSA